MEVKIIYAGALFLVGWLWMYLFGRQFLFNIFTAFPLIKKMQTINGELISGNAKRYTIVSVGLCVVVSAIAIALVLFLCPIHLKIGFGIGALCALLMLVNRVSPATKSNFESFCLAYYRFVPDDELRTAMYNKKFSQVKSRLKAMGYKDSFVPEFKN